MFGFVLVEAKAKDPIIPLSLFRNPIFVNATAIGLTMGLGMFAAIGFVPTFLQMSSGTSAAASGLLMLPMMVGLIGTSILSGMLITRTGRYRMFPILGTLITGAAMVAMTTLAADTPIWLICIYLFVFGAGLGLIMQVVVLVTQNSVDAAMIGTATSTNNYFREMGASLGVAVFGTIFTTRLTENLTDVSRVPVQVHRMPQPRLRPSTADSQHPPRPDPRRRRDGVRRRTRARVLVPAALHRHRLRSLPLPQADPAVGCRGPRRPRRSHRRRPGRGTRSSSTI